MSYHFAAVVPCYNVGKACVPVLLDTVRFVDYCVVVDDGSSDDTSAQIASVDASNLHLIRHDRNRGKGAALLTAFRHLLQRNPEIDAVFTLDGDGQHDPLLIPSFVKVFEEAQPDLIYGNRMTRIQGMPLHRQWLNRLSNRIISRICRRPIADSQCGFRLHSSRMLREMIDRLRSSRYELETEILIEACRRDFRVASVPVSMIYSVEANQLSHHSFADVLRIARLLGRQW